MKNHVYLAIFLSVILVGGAAWVRFSQEKEPSMLAVVESLEANDETYQDFLSDYLVNSTSTVSLAASSEKIGTTDLISRQLINDYVSLSTNGQATQNNIGALAEKYVDAIPTLISPEKVNPTDFRITPNNKADFEYYAREVERIYRDYASRLIEIQSQKNINDMILSSSGNAAKNMGTIYEQTAQKLKVVPVPKALIEAHIDLTNIYLENAAAMDSLSQINSDPASAFAGLMLLSGNVNEEALIMGKIEQILSGNGI
jgi:hypothetical protein